MGHSISCRFLREVAKQEQIIAIASGFALFQKWYEIESYCVVHSPLKLYFICD